MRDLLFFITFFFSDCGYNSYLLLLVSKIQKNITKEKKKNLEATTCAPL